MFDIKVLSTNNSREWQDYLNRLPDNLKDPHYLREYLLLFERLPDGEPREHFGGRGFLFFCGDSDNYIIYPFFKRSIPCGINSTSYDLFDIVSPYGYAGPLAVIPDLGVRQEIWRTFFHEFDRFCINNNVVSEFCRLHPLFNNHIEVEHYSNHEISLCKQVVLVNLNDSDVELLGHMGSSRRRQVKKALSNPELSISFVRDAQSIDTFFNLYHTTMVRTKASPKFFLPKTFISDALNLMGSHICLATVYYKDTPVAASMYLLNGLNVYYWLVGSIKEYLKYYPMVYLIYNSILKFKSEGYRWLVLGGGLSENDSLYRFKYLFSNRVTPFFVSKKMYMDKIYEQLMLTRIQDYKPGFFPAYRS
jgi:serine/alanine adding enzyme